MIITEHVHISHRALEKINLNHPIILFDDIKNIDLDLPTINKTCIKILILLVMKSNISQCRLIMVIMI